MSEFQSTHKLDFMTRPWWLDNEMIEFKVGTIQGMYFTTDHDYVLLAIINDEPGNGHLTDALEWFENSCRRDNKSLRVTEFSNMKFRTHLIKKRGFKSFGQDCIKRHHNMTQK